MNFRYDHDVKDPLEHIIDQRPAAGVHDIRRAHPALQAMSLDHLTLLIERLNRRRLRSRQPAGSAALPFEIARTGDFPIFQHN